VVVFSRSAVRLQSRQTSDNRRQSWSATGHAVSSAIEQGRTRSDVRQSSSVGLFITSRGRRQATVVGQPGEARRSRRSKPEKPGEASRRSSEKHTSTSNCAVLMEKQQQDGNTSQLSLDERFSEDGRRSSARLRHQSLDRGMDRPSLNQRFGGDVGEQPPMTAPHCRWIQASSTDRQPLDQRFSGGHCRLSATGLHHLRTAVERQDKGDPLQRPTTATTSVGQQAREPTVAALHSGTGRQTSSSHSTGVSTNVEDWTSDEQQQSSIHASAGAQLRNTDKASKTEMELKSAAHDKRATTSDDIGSTESRPVALGWPLGYHESDRPSSLYDGMVGQRPSPLAVSSTQGGSSEDHPSTESPGGRKRVDVYRQVNLNGCSIGEGEITCQLDPPHRFNIKIRIAICGVHIAESLLVGRNFVSGICKLKP